jgi:hypothetical protein
MINSRGVFMQNKTYENNTYVAQRPAYGFNQPPKQAYDMEYGTQSRKEFEYLKDHGMLPVFVKKSEYGIKTYKYTKTPALFKLLVDYFTAVKAEKEYDKLNREIENNKTPLSEEEEHEIIDSLIDRGAPIRKARIYA